MFNIIVATDKNWGIGKNGSLPWSFKKDINIFKSYTTSEFEKSIVIMGRVTWKVYQINILIIE